MPQIPERIIPQSLNDYLEQMTKSVFQSGMSWAVVDKKWPGIVEALHGFDVRAVASLDEHDLEQLAQDTRVIRNRRKLAAIVHNAVRMLELDAEYGTFQAYLRAQGDFDATLKTIRKDFKFMGPTGIYVFLWRVSEEVIPHDAFEAKYRR